MADEVEVKFRITEARRVRARMRTLGFRVTAGRRREQNWIFDDAAGRLHQHDLLLRLRRSGRDWILTVKGKRRAGPLKKRRELETKVEDGAATRELLGALGYGERLRYSRHRTRYEAADHAGELAWDETPMGIYIELEGPGGWIRATAAGLGLEMKAAETRSYPALYAEWRDGRKVR